MKNILRLVNRNALLGTIIKLFAYIGLNLISIYYEVGGFLRVHFFPFGKYKDNKFLKDKYKGKRCFIICTGPSLRIEDVEKLKNEYTFGMNSLCLLSEKSEFRPKFFACIDLIVFRKFKDKIRSFTDSCENVFVSDRIARHERLEDGWSVLPVNVAYHTYDRWFRNKYWCKFSGDCFRVVYDMYSVTHVLIQMAIYMGFSKIYLLGADCSFKDKEHTHFIEYGTLDNDLDSAEERCLSGYYAVKEYADKHDVEIINVTRGGKLELFKRENLDELL